MYFTQAIFDGESFAAREALRSPKSIHGLVEAALDGKPKPEEGQPRTLWRVDSINSPTPILYITSPHQLDLPDGDHWTVRTAPYSPVLDRIKDGTTWSFRTTINPVHSVPPVKDVKPGERRRGIATPHMTAAHQTQWLTGRAERIGVRFLGEPSRIECRTLSFRQRVDLKRKVQLTQATFTGALEVTDQDLFRRTLTHGLGRAKGYGCGLITIASI